MDNDLTLLFISLFYNFVTLFTCLYILIDMQDVVSQKDLFVRNSITGTCFLLLYDQILILQLVVSE